MSSPFQQLLERRVIGELDGCPDVPPSIGLLICDHTRFGRGAEMSLIGMDGTIRAGVFDDLMVWRQMMDHLRYAHGIEKPGAAHEHHRHAWFRAAVALLMD